MKRAAPSVSLARKATSVLVQMLRRAKLAHLVLTILLKANRNAFLFRLAHLSPLLPPLAMHHVMRVISAI
jgi:hypothetical protein